MAFLFYGDGLGQVARTVDVAAAQHGDMVREQLHRDHRQDALKAVDSVWHFDELRGVLLGLDVASFADNDWTALAGSHLLQSIDTFLPR